MAKPKVIKKVIHKPTTFSTVSEWLQQRDRPKGQPMTDSLFWLAALTATYERVYGCHEDEEYEVDDDDIYGCYGNTAHFTDLDGNRSTVFQKAHLRQLWNALGEETRHPKDMLKTLYETVSALSCYEGLLSESIEDFLVSRVEDAVRTAWARLMKEFLSTININGMRLTGFLAAGSEQLELTVHYPHWSLAFAYKMFDHDRVGRFAKILYKKADEESPVEQM